MLTNKHRSFHNSCVIETGLSDFHKMAVSILKSYFEKAEHEVIFYRDYKKFSNDRFRSTISNPDGSFRGHHDLDFLLDICTSALDEIAPIKQKYVRANNAPFINRTILKEIMKRTRMRNKFLRERTEASRKLV